LFPEPGQWRVVRWGDFKEVLSPQLANAERLRDAHRLPCYVQVFEATAPLRLDALAANLNGNSNPPRLQPLTHALALQLQLMPLLPPVSRTVRPAQGEPGWLFPGQRALRLQVAMDPTADPPGEARQSADGNSAHAPTASPQPPTPQAPPSPTSPNQPAANAPSEPCLKTSIPEVFLKPWEFRISRDEALYDVAAADSFLKAVGRAFRRQFGSRREWRKWQVLLSGKNLDEQLWAIRPPKDGLRHPFIREWALRTLELAGYDSRTMLNEWEIFWRRKGL
jgi:hypothetical protein